MTARVSLGPVAAVISTCHC